MAKETTLKEIGEMLSFVVEHMATKDDIADVRKDMATKGDIKEVEVRVTGKIDKVDATIERVDSKLGAFEDHEVDKRKQLEVRVLRVEQKL